MQGTVRQSLMAPHQKGKERAKTLKEAARQTMVGAQFATRWTIGKTSAHKTLTRARAKEAISRMAKGEAKGVKEKVNQDFEL